MNSIDKITTEMVEHICDNICKHPGNVSSIGITPDELEDICAECKMGRFVCDILNSPSDKWILCSGRLPSESGWYLVTYREWSDGKYLPKFDNEDVRRLRYRISEEHTGWSYPVCCDPKAESDTHREVLAWQPLPEPYKGVIKWLKQTI